MRRESTHTGAAAGGPRVRRRLGETFRQGFTLIELLVVCAIIGILAVIIAAKIQSAIRNAKAAQSIANMKSIEAAVHMYLGEVANEYPGDFTDRKWAMCTVWGIDWCFGGNNVLPEMKRYIEAIPDNTLTAKAGGTEGPNFLWHSNYWAGVSPESPFCGNEGDNYPSNANEGFYYNRRMLFVMLNSNATWTDGRKIYELGQPWADANKPCF